MKIAIIGGAGKMGQWLAHFLFREGFEVIISDRNEAALRSLAEDPEVNILSTGKAVEEADIVLISVNIDSFEAAVREISSHARPGQIIADVTSIKELPVELMHRYLQGATILGMHPLFGPGAKDLSNQNFVLTPTNEKERELARKATDLLEKHGARVTTMTPREHDEIMSVVLGLAHFITIAAADTLIEIGKMTQLKAVGGSTYRVLTTLVESVVSEDPELYATLQMHLPYVREMETLFRSKADKWAEMVRNKDRSGFVNNMSALKKRFAEENADFGQAYKNMYKIMEWL